VNIVFLEINGIPILDAVPIFSAGGPKMRKSNAYIKILAIILAFGCIAHTASASIGLSGFITDDNENPLIGVTVFSWGLEDYSTTDENGYYELSAPIHWSGTVHVRKSGYTFEPLYKRYTDVTTDQVDQNYTYHSAPVTPKPIAPFDGEVIKNLTPIFRWSAFQSGENVATQAGYQLRVRSIDDNGRKVYDTGLILDTTGSSHTYQPPGTYRDFDPIAGCYLVSEPLEYARHYLWHVRYYDSKGDWGPWSADFPQPIQDFHTRALVVTLNRLDMSDFPTIGICLSIVDISGIVIGDLEAFNFRMTENGVATDQFEVSPPGICSLPISVTLALDYSNSMDMGEGQPIQNLKNAARTFIEQLNLEPPIRDDADAVEIIKFSSQYSTTVDTPGVRVVQPFTNDKEALENAINEGDVGGQTPLYDAIYRAVTDTAAQSGQQAVIVMTDGYDNIYGDPVDVKDPTHAKSEEQLEKIIQHSKYSCVPVYTIGLGNKVITSVLEKIANKTGGEYYYTPTSDGLEEIYINIAKALKDQYRLIYETRIQHPRRLALEVKATVDGITGRHRKVFLLEPAIPMPWLQLLLDK
jgi:hypothetical protein